MSLRNGLEKWLVSLRNSFGKWLRRLINHFSRPLRRLNNHFSRTFTLNFWTKSANLKVKGVYIEFFTLIMVFTRVISFIYQNFYPSDRVPLSNPFTADVLIQQRTQLKRHMFGNWFSFSFFFSQLSLLVIFYYFLLTWLWFFWGDLICLPVLRFFKTFSCWHPCRIKEQRTRHHTSYSTHKIIMYSIIMNGLFQCQILTNHHPINVHPTFLLVYR